MDVDVQSIPATPENSPRVLVSLLKRGEGTLFDGHPHHATWYDERLRRVPVKYLDEGAPLDALAARMGADHRTVVEVKLRGLTAEWFFVMVLPLYGQQQDTLSGERYHRYWQETLHVRLGTPMECAHAVALYLTGLITDKELLQGAFRHGPDGADLALLRAED